jgi:glutathione S-transferase
MYHYIPGAVETRTVTYADLQTDTYAAVNPLKKVPALIDAQGSSLFEASVILNYLEDTFTGVGSGGGGAAAAGFRPATAEAHAAVERLVRVHDLYIASPNNTQPGFSHTQGAMYLAPFDTPFTPAARAMGNRATRAAKIAEIWKQLSWLEAQLERRGGPFLAGAAVTHADITWHPTCVFMEHMLPSVFGWPHSLFSVPRSSRSSSDADTVEQEEEEPARAPSPLPRVTAWYRECCEIPAFQAVRETILAHWRKMDELGMFDPIRQEVKDGAEEFKWKYP